MTARVTALAVHRREAVLAVVALLSGLAIAYLDSRPGWDADGITVAALLAAAFATAFLAGRRPWLFALLVGVWTPLVEVPAGAWGSLVALAFAAVGAAAGYLAARPAREARDG